MEIVHNLFPNAIPPREKPEKVIPSNAFANNNWLKKCLDFNSLGAENVQAIRSAESFCILIFDAFRSIQILVWLHGFSTFLHISCF